MFIDKLIILSTIYVDKKKKCYRKLYCNKEYIRYSL